MTIRLDDNFISEVGLAELPTGELSGFLAMFSDSLEFRVGERIAGALSNQELDEFGEFEGQGNDPAALAWLETHVPKYQEIVREEFAELSAEIRSRANEILFTFGVSKPQPNAVVGRVEGSSDSDGVAVDDPESAVA